MRQPCREDTLHTQYTHTHNNTSMDKLAFLQAGRRANETKYGNETNGDGMDGWLLPSSCYCYCWCWLGGFHHKKETKEIHSIWKLWRLTSLSDPGSQSVHDVCDNDLECWFVLLVVLRLVYSTGRLLTG
jgi:hypothetical protein